MREGDQVNRRVIGQQRDVGALRQRRQQLHDDRVAGLVADMDDPPGAVRGFQAVDQFVILVAVET